MARRAGYTKLLSEQSAGEAAILQVDSGFLFDDNLAAETLGYDTAVRDRWTLDGYEAAGIQVANLSYRDLAFLETMTAPRELKANVKRYPFLEKLISANVEPIDATVTGFKPYTILEARSKRLGARPIRVAFLGLTQPPPPPLVGPNVHVVAPFSKKYAIKDPLEAAKRFVPELRKQADLVVLLTYMSIAEAQKIGQLVPGIDAIITANQIPLQVYQVQQAGDAILAPVVNQTKNLSELRLYTDPAKPGTLVNYTHRQVPLDEAIPDDPKIKTLVDDAHDAFTKAVNGTK